MKILKAVAFVLAVVLLSSCLYKMPKEDDFSTIPTTNNPAVTRDADGPQQMPMPGIEY